MKTIITIFFILIHLTCFSQSFIDLLNEYEKECNSIIKDTIEQTGNINYEYVPVKDEQGNTIHFVFGKADTTWNKPNCQKYKNPIPYSQIVDGRLYGYSSTSNFSFHNADTNTGLANFPIVSTEKQEKHIVRITRDYVCDCKLRELEPFGNHFWAWIKERSNKNKQ